MYRREFIRASAGVAASASLAGCTGISDVVETRPFGVPPVLEDRPDRVYVPTHVESMAVADTRKAEGHACALAYTYPHRFWLVTGSHTKKVDIGPDDSVHLMPVVWHRATGVVPGDVALTVTVARDGDRLTRFRPWPMLSQPMGFHFGDNVSLPGDGTYSITVEMRASGATRTGALADAPTSAAFEFAFEYRASRRDALEFSTFPDREGTLGAVDPATMGGLPSTQLPRPGDVPGTPLGTARSGDVRFVAAALTDAPRFGDGTYLAVSPRTPYNRYPLPLSSLSGTVTRGGATVFDDALVPHLDPELGYHYGATVPDLSPDDSITVGVDAPPQVARHEGYETAFLDVPDAELTR
ncbi:MAG: hypothetical protein ABEJ28_11960 [Salinigranum sp.]